MAEQTGSTPPPRNTSVTIACDQFYINGCPTYEGRFWKGKRIEGLLMNVRTAQGIFDDENPETIQRWAYPDTGKWDPDRNTREFVEAMPAWREHGLIAFDINLQGGSPEGYSKEQPWHNSAFTADGDLKPAYMERLRLILDRADELGMVAVLGVFYFGPEPRMNDEDALHRGLDKACRWVLENGYTNVIIEVNNECDNRKYHYPLSKPDRVTELIRQAQGVRVDGRRLLAGVSLCGGRIPSEAIALASDYLLLHGNGVSDPARIAEMVRETRALRGGCAKPIFFNEDDHFDFDKPDNNFVAAVGEYAGWGYFEPGESNYRDGHQSPPVNWGINTPRKQAFFNLLKEITGS